MPGSGRRRLVNLVAVAPPTGPANTQSTVPSWSWPTATTRAVARARTTTPREPGRSWSSRGTSGTPRSRTRSSWSPQTAAPTAALGAAHFARDPALRERRIAAARQPRRDRGRAARRGSSSPATPPASPSPTLLATADASIESETEARAETAGRARAARRPRVPVQLLRAGAVRRATASRGHDHRPATVARARPLATRSQTSTRSRSASSAGPRRCSSARSTSRPRSRPGRSPTSTSGRAFSTAGRSNSSCSLR